MNKFIAVAAAGAVAVVASLSLAAPSQAFFPGLFIAGAVAGSVAAAADAYDYDYDYGYRGHHGYFAYNGFGHKEACADTYATYDWRSDTYVAKIVHGHPVRVYCEL